MLGDWHPLTLTWIGNIALLLAVKGDLDGAELCREALEATLGDTATGTRTTLKLIKRTTLNGLGALAKSFARPRHPARRARRG